MKTDGIRLTRTASFFHFHPRRHLAGSRHPRGFDAPPLRSLPIPESQGRAVTAVPSCAQRQATTRSLSAPHTRALLPENAAGVRSTRRSFHPFVRSFPLGFAASAQLPARGALPPGQVPPRDRENTAPVRWCPTSAAGLSNPCARDAASEHIPSARDRRKA